MEASGAEKERQREEQREESEEEYFVCLDESFFINRNYELTTFTFGSHVLELLCLQSASTDYDLTGQLVWPGSVLLNNFLCKNTDILKGCSVIELGSGVGITGILCHRFCREVVLTDHNDEVLEILKKNIELQASSESPYTAGLMAEKLEWGNVDHISQILQKYPSGFDIILGADIYILILSFCLFFIFLRDQLRIFSYSPSLYISFQQASIPLLFSTVEKLLSIHDGQCRFILAYVSRAKTMDEMVLKEAVKRGMQIREAPGTRTMISNLEGVIFEITLH